MEVAELLNKAQAANVREARDALAHLVGLILDDAHSMAVVFRCFCESINVLLAHRKTEIPRSVFAFVSELLKKLRLSKRGSNFTHNFIKYLLRGLDSKLRHVRINSLLLIRSSIESLEAVSPKLWSVMKTKIGEKLFDKEASVRVQAVHIVEKYQDMLVDEGISFARLLKDLLRYDPSAEVRKLALGAINISEHTVSSVISRAVDANEGVRMFFVSNRLLSIDWAMLSQRERAFLVNSLEAERNEEIRRRFVERFEVLFEETFQGQYEVLVSACFVESDANASLKRLLRLLMKSYEYTVAFDEAFLSRATPALVFLMNTALAHVEEERGRDAIVLPDLEIILKCLIDSSLSMTEEQAFAGSTPESLFGIVEYYDVFQHAERLVVFKFILYILTHPQDLRSEVTDSVVRLLCKINHGTDDYVKILGKVISHSLVPQLPADPRRPQELDVLTKPMDIIVKVLTYFPGICDSAIFHRMLDDLVLPSVESPDVPLKSRALEALFLIAVSSGTFSLYQDTFMREASSSSLEIQALAANILCDACILTKKGLLGESGALEWILAHLGERLGVPGIERGICKLLLADVPGEKEKEDLVVALLSRFYGGGQSDHEAQFLHVFFYEYFRSRHWILISVYSRAVREMVHWKVFNDQVVFWYEKNKAPEYACSELLILVLACVLKAARQAEGAGWPREEKELVGRHLDLLGKVLLLKGTFDAEAANKVIGLASSISRHIAKVFSDNDVVKNILFEFISNKSEGAD